MRRKFFTVLPARLRRVFLAERGQFAAPFVDVEAGGFAGAGGEVGVALDEAQAAQALTEQLTIFSPARRLSLLGAARVW